MTKRYCLSLVVAVAVAAAAGGCATKKYVKTTVDPVNSKVAELDKRASENTKAIEQLDEKTQRDIARVGERAGAADARAGEAGRQAAEAGNRAGQAIEKADGARTLADNSMARAGRLEKVVEGLDNFRLFSTTKIYFPFNKSDLSDEARKELDGVAQSLASHRRYAIEVQGFADSIGTAEYNYALSGRRGDAVVRYLTTQHKVPVYRVHTVGLGKDAPVEASSPTEARRLSRRVEVRVFTPQ